MGSPGLAAPEISLLQLHPQITEVCPHEILAALCISSTPELGGWEEGTRAASEPLEERQGGRTPSHPQQLPAPPAPPRALETLPAAVRAVEWDLHGGQHQRVWL